MAQDSSNAYERPMVEPDNLMTGGFQSGRYDAAPQVRTGRTAARRSLILSVLWLGGVGSLVALPMAVLALGSGDIGTAHRRMAQAGAVLGAIGLVVTIVLFAPW
ncbi:MAG: hypothetical protein ACSLFP_03615 [Acidimicrobiales bacterium]